MTETVTHTEPPTEPEARAWLTVPEAGMYLAGLGRSASYAAAARGEIPTLRIGRRIVVPVSRLEALLDGSGEA